MELTDLKTLDPCGIEQSIIVPTTARSDQRQLQIIITMIRKRGMRNPPLGEASGEFNCGATMLNEIGTIKVDIKFPNLPCT